jgi:S1-C subfamily serine protease
MWLFSLLLTTLLFAEAKPLQTVTTKDGTIYYNVTVAEIKGDQVVLFHSSGVVTTSLDNIPDDARKALGLPTSEVVEAKKKKQEEAIEAQKKKQEEYERQQQAKGLVKYDNQWITPAEKAKREAERAAQTAKKEAEEAIRKINAKAENIVLSNTNKDVGFRIIQPMENGSLCMRLTGEFFFLYGASNQIVAEGDRLRGDLFWCGTYMYTSVARAQRTVNSYALSLDAAREILKRKFNMTGPSKVLDRQEQNKPQENLPANIKGSGSGFAITSDGYILTCYHVVGKANAVFVKIEAGGDLLPAKVIASDSGNDLALLKISKRTEAAAFASIPTAKLGQTIFTVGFPMPDLQGFSPKVTKGVISSLKGMNDDIRRYQIDATVQPGNSGGPLADENGNILGVVVAKLNEAAVIEEKGVVPQNVNYAIKLSYIMAFISSVPEVSEKVEQAKGSSTIPFEGAVEKIRKATVLIVIK